MTSMNVAWRALLEKVHDQGREFSPRGMPVKELLHQTLEVHMAEPVLTLPLRKLNYEFMVAEALWILRGQDYLAPLTAVNKRMAEFSDDGVTLKGAYGPRFTQQLDYVVRTLADDQLTRRATLTLWIPNPGPSKDIPCTVALDFKIRDSVLSCHVFMRSSDVWLGAPYDVFSFTMMAAQVLYHYRLMTGKIILLGPLYLTAASSHLYAEHYDKAEALLQRWSEQRTLHEAPVQPDGPWFHPAFWVTQGPIACLEQLTPALLKSWGRQA